MSTINTARKPMRAPVLIATSAISPKGHSSISRCEALPGAHSAVGRRKQALPGYAQREFEDHLNCGRLEHGFLRVRCGSCHEERLVAISCKRRGFCPCCGARRMAESSALLKDLP